ncbi:MAG: Sphingolipid C4-hydroxylase sur2 [Candelina mexicana]|nr:MAG: Sphingolipid C4-hydroxylase sur2 [Candelina mexicana]
MISSNITSLPTGTCIPHPIPPLVAPLPDKYTLLLLPVVAYWTLSLTFHFCDTNNILSKYKLHTPAEFLRRNRVSVHDVVKEVLTQHVMQTILGGIIAYFEPDEMAGCEDRDIAAWALSISSVLKNLAPLLAATATTVIPATKFSSLNVSATTFDVLLAKSLYWFLIPAFQYVLAAFFIDTWQYIIHRTMHTYPWLYRTFHSRHHRLYVPYAFGALYNHPFEGLVEDTVGSLLAFKVARMSVRQGIYFFTLSTCKTVDDHSGFRLPWDPLQWITENNAYYHDIHHQSWGMKVSLSFLSSALSDANVVDSTFFSMVSRADETDACVGQSNFSQPFTSFWDRVFGTRWAGSESETNKRYESGKALAGKAVAFKNE